MFTLNTKRGDLLFVETSGLRQNNLLSDNLGEIVDSSIYITFSTFTFYKRLDTEYQNLFLNKDMYTISYQKNELNKSVFE